LPPSKRPEVSPRPDRRLRHDVLGIIGVASERSRQPVCRVAVRQDESVKARVDFHDDIVTVAEPAFH
jgi:hypothetical protein